MKLFSISMGILAGAMGTGSNVLVLGKKKFLALIQQRDLTGLP